jgi:hypothetical protein
MGHISSRPIFQGLIVLVLLLVFLIPSSVSYASTSTIHRYYPTSTTEIVQPGDTVSFSIGAEDSDGDLWAAEWYVGSTSMKWDPWTKNPNYYSESIWSYTFNSVGTFYVYAYVYDKAGHEAMIWWEITVQSINYTPSASFYGTPPNEIFPTITKTVTVDYTDSN